MKTNTARPSILPNNTWVSLLIASLCAATVVPAAYGAPLQAGTARMEITPPQPVMLAGYESRKELSKGIHDPLFARALAFQKDADRLVLVSTDNLGFYGGTAEPIRNAIMQASGLKPAELFLCAIHTHSAPSLTLDPARGHSNNVAYTESLQKKLVELVRQALSRLAPVEISSASGASPVGVNRRQLVRDSSDKPNIILGRNTEALIDREVQVLKLARAGENPPGAVLFAYATHSTSLGPGNYFVSGDIHGIAEQFVEQYLGREAVAAGFAGASGNIDPWVRVLPDFRTNNGWIPEPVLMGTMLGEEVARTLERTQAAIKPTKIATRMETVSLPAKPGVAGAPSTKAFTVTLACLGEIAFVGWGGEVFNEIGMQVKKNSPFKQTFIFTHCNATAGYVPIQSSYDEGGYEVRTSSFAPGAGELLGQDTVRLLRELKASAEAKAGS